MSNGIGDVNPWDWRLCSNDAICLVNSIVRRKSEIGPATLKFMCGGQHQICDLPPVACPNGNHVFTQWMGMHGHFWVHVFAHLFFCLSTDGAIAQSRSLRATANDSYMFTHSDGALLKCLA